MNWIKIIKTDRIPSKEFLVTDGKDIDIKLNAEIMNTFVRRKIKVQDATHYMLLSDIPLPQFNSEKCFKNCSRSMCDFNSLCVACENNCELDVKCAKHY